MISKFLAKSQDTVYSAFTIKQNMSEAVCAGVAELTETLFGEIDCIKTVGTTQRSGITPPAFTVGFVRTEILDT